MTGASGRDLFHRAGGRGASLLVGSMRQIHAERRTLGLSGVSAL
eukprot:COSAG02_NODE_21219_length_797_cov_1.727794_2_plen_43_part_01